MPMRAWENFDESRRGLIAKLAQVRAEGRKLIYLDEVVFTKRTFLGVNWSRKHEHTQVDQQ